MTTSYQHVYLSPHYDDISLSCGGAVYQHIQAGEPALVITVCAAPPNPGDPLSPFAQELHRRWGSPEDVVATRRAEDEAAMTVLAAHSIRLDFADCIYRGRPVAGEWYYTNNAQLFGQIHRAEQPLIQQIAAEIQRVIPPGTRPTLYAPLGVGNHVDHQLVHAAARHLAQQGYPVIYYEDYPYADPDYAPHGQDNPYDLPAALTRLQPLALEPQVRPISDQALQIKIDSIAAYESQLDILFGGPEAMARKVSRYARQVGSGAPAERVWLPG